MRRLYKATLDSRIEKELQKFGWKLDWLGRPYQLFDINDDAWTDERYMNNFIYAQIDKIMNILSNIYVTDIIKPETVKDLKEKRILVHLKTPSNAVKSFFTAIKNIFVLMLFVGIFFIIIMLIGLI